eukprot:CAMPEP_0168723358 /NCGR_PEP_ID=MMETSP0724-20121128/3074_1 /TAXON_ID=265536 /ORGANISM="Amphiprora sp., Strain CCMP467" /LENGTH=481 /DNA_ID=CAMNT_0008770063 /DNA_START=153 /DNA_END=1598 /DNA_ORIENTATION=+
MSSNNNSDSARNPPAAPARPEFRSVQMQTNDPRYTVQRPQSMATAKPAPAARNDVINMDEFRAGAVPAAMQQETAPGKSSNWAPTAPRPVPAFYPLEKSTRLVEDETPMEVASRLSESLRYMSVQAVYNDEAATANLYTAENVEMHMSLWMTPSTAQQNGVLVELQRRKGDSMVFHRYARRILDAAVGDIEESDLADSVDADKIYSKKVQRLLSPELKNQDHQEHENAVVALEIAHGLIMKDRMDARQLGLESLCLLTDPAKTGYMTAVLASHVVLLGSTGGVEIAGVTDAPGNESILKDEGPFQEIRETILSLVQFSRIGEDEEDEATSPESESMILLHNLALAVLANALEVVEHPERYIEDDNEDNDDVKQSPRPRLNTQGSEKITEEFLSQSEEFSKKDLLKTLIGELGNASAKPHNATLSAKCIGSLCRASDEAKRRAKELGAKTVVATALDVGVKTHLKLETECQKVFRAMETQND